MDGDDALVGIGGWLAFFMAGMGIFVPFVIVYDLFSIFGQRNSYAAMSFGGDWLLLEMGEMVLAILSLGLCAIIVTRLAGKRDWETVQIVVAAIWALGVGRALVEILLFRLAGISGPTDAFLLGLIRPLVVCILWTAYFLRSRRVANTYLRDAADETADI